MFESFDKKENTQEQTGNFRELAPEQFWGGSIPLEGITPEEFAAKIEEVTKETGFTYPGYISQESYRFSRYPRRAFGPVAPIEKYQEALKKLADKTGVIGEEEKITEQPRFRVLLGLQEGYAEYKKNNIVEQIGKGEISSLEEAKNAITSVLGDLSEFGIDINRFTSLELLKDALSKSNLGKQHSLEEVRRELGENFDLETAEIYTVGSWGKYTEPAVVIQGDKTDLQRVYALADRFRQSRIAVEDLEKGKSYMVETKYCEDPDKE